ncbi:DUF6093 family protein [Microbacterium enclense]|uniref:DUF6093 family protein n=1 Tax=Microbacterium enclense TaxID=993073 RepID=UPI00342109A2
MIPAGRLVSARRSTEALHRDTFTVYRATGEVVKDPILLTETPVYAVVAKRVQGKFKASGADNRDVQTPGMKVAETGLEWHTSLDVRGILTDDEVECVAVDPDTGDPDNVGRRVRVTGPFIKSIATARRFRVSELT